jgi:formamidopyrimidine-DNA glycosylase
MPELPDLEVFAKNLHAMYAGRQLTQVKILYPGSLKSDRETFATQLEGQFLKEVFRSGKELRFLFSNNNLLGLHLMLHGKLYRFDNKNENKYTLVEFYFHGTGLALTDYQKSANIQLNPEEKNGIDALSGKLNLNNLKKALQSNQKIKDRITNQNVIRGIGNAYADEILWEAKIHPNSVSGKIPDDKIKVLVKAIKKVLENARKEILKTHPDIIAGEVRDFLKIHNSRKEKSPTGAIIKVEKKGGSTYYTDEQLLFE